MRRYDDVFDCISTKDDTNYATYGQTYYDYHGCLPEDDDIIDHIKTPRLIAVYR